MKLLKDTGFEIFHIPHDIVERDDIPSVFVGITLVEAKFGECKKDLHDNLLNGITFPDDETRKLFESNLDDCEISYNKKKF